jgi:flagellar hook-length control protein FliK
VKPLLGQAQSQLNLDDLFSSSKSVAGNFSRPLKDVTSQANSSSRKPNFSEVLLRNLEDTKSAKPSAEVRTATEARPSKISTQDSKEPTTRGDNLEGLERQHRTQANDLSTRQPYKSPNRESIDSNVDLEDTGPSRLQNEQLSSSGRQTADNQVADNKAATSNAPQKLDPALAPLQKQIGDKLTTDNVVNNNAILAFITGRLDKLEPDTLPALLADSQLIKQVLGSGDVAKFMESPQSINDLANLLELDQGLLSKAARDGLNPSDLVKPKEFIKALGIDPGQVTSELTILQQKLPAEGVAPYIDRARALAAVKNKSELIPNTAEMPTTKAGQKRIQQATPSLESTVPSQTSEEPANHIDRGLASMLMSGAAVQASRPAASDSVSVNSDIRQPDAIKAASLGAVNTNSSSISDGSIIMTSVKKLNPDVITSNDPDQPLLDAFRSGINPMAVGIGPSLNIEDVDAISSDEPVISEPVISEPVISEPDFQLTVSQTDPFAMSSSEIDQRSSTRIEFAGNGLQARSLEEILLDRNVNLSIQTKQTNHVKDESDEISLIASDVTDIEQIKTLNLELADKTDTITPLADSSLGVSLGSSEQSFRDGGSSFDERGQDTLSDIATSMDAKVSSNKDSSVSFSSKLTAPAASQPRETLAQRILGQAEIMFKNGGGSMRMDVEAPGIGKVDVAINLNNNQLDIRIITASDQARDIITRDVAGLRDGLTQQGLNLRGLEVGKAGESSSRNFAGQGGQHFGQGAQDQRASYNDMKEYVQSFRNSYIPRSSDRLDSSSPSLGRWNNVAARSTSGSRLEVRV